MDKVTLIGLNLVSNSIGMALKKAAPPQEQQVVGFDPDRSHEEAALRRHFSVDSIAPDLETAVRGAGVVIVSTPLSAVREVFEAMNAFLDEGTTVTDTLPTKSQVLAWAAELLNKGSGFVGGHVLSRKVELEVPSELEMPSADLFSKAPYCIMPLPSASSNSMNHVIALAQIVGARPLFIDPYEHDSLFAAASHLPMLAGTAYLRLLSESPSRDDVADLAGEPFDSMTKSALADPVALQNAVSGNSQALIHWVDQYILTLHDLREMLIANSVPALHEAVTEAKEMRHVFDQRDKSQDESDPLAQRRVHMDDKARIEMNQAIADTNPARRLLGGYLVDRVFRKRDNQ